MTPERLRIRSACPADEPWINTQYERLGFAPSDLRHDRVLLAEVNAHRVGLGRLVPINARDVDLGGIFVIEEYRCLGIAARLVESLLKECASYSRVFCLPFAHLGSFYRRYGFRDVESHDFPVPQSIRRKHEWCLRKHDPRTLLLVLHP